MEVRAQMDDKEALAATVRFNADMNRHMIWRFKQGAMLKPKEAGVCAGAVMEWLRRVTAASQLPTGDNLIFSPEYKQFNSRARELQKTYGAAFDEAFSGQSGADRRGFSAAMRKIGLSLNGEGPVYTEDRTPRLDGTVFSRCADAGGLWLVSIIGDDAAHAVGVRARGPGAQMVDVDFFDPNYGLYRLANSGALGSFCDRLMGLYAATNESPYTKAMAWQVNPPPLNGGRPSP